MKARFGFLATVLLCAAAMLQMNAATPSDPRAGATGPPAGGPEAPTPHPGRRAPVFFNVQCHQEGVCSVSHLCWEEFKADAFSKLDMLDDWQVVSDQCFSDFIVSVALYMGDLSLFERFRASPYAMLGYHFHPTTADVGIRSNMILDLGFDKAVEAYGYWEESYYDWAACLGTGEDWPILCGKLDPSRLGGIQLMEQYFGRITTSECASLALAPVGQAFRRKYIIPRGQDIVCWTSGPHASYANIQKMWRNDWSPAAEPCIYVYKMMGLHFAKATSSSFVESTHPPSLLAQKLAILPRDVPHIFMIHLVGPTDPLRELLAYIHGTFIPANPGSQFICSADIPRLVIPNPRRFTMPELEEAARCFLRGFAGRPPAFVEYGEGRYMSDASLFKALQAALQAYLTAMVESGSRPRVPPRRLWPARVEVPDFIYPPLGYKEDEVEDYRVGDAISLSTFAAAVMELPEEDDRVPYQVAITVPEQPGIVVYANAAEFLTGMCELFLRLRGPAPSQMSDSMHMIPGYLIPISNLPLEDARAATTEPGPLTRLDWYNDLQLWTLEPLRLRTSLPSPGPAVPPASR